MAASYRHRIKRDAARSFTSEYHSRRWLAEESECAALQPSPQRQRILYGVTLMGLNKRKMEDAHRHEAEKEAAARRATEKQILEDADHLIAVWNERQAKRMPMLFSPTIGAAITAG